MSTDWRRSREAAAGRRTRRSSRSTAAFHSHRASKENIFMTLARARHEKRPQWQWYTHSIHALSIWLCAPNSTSRHQENVELVEVTMVVVVGAMEYSLPDTAPCQDCTMTPSVSAAGGEKTTNRSPVHQFYPGQSTTPLHYN